MKAFLASLVIFIVILALLALSAFLVLVDTSPMGKTEYLLRLGRFTVFRYTGIGSLNEAEVKSVYESRCTRKCHSRDVIERSAHTAREWEEIVNRMRTVNKAKVTDSELRVIIPYLAKRFGSNIPTILTPGGSRFLKKYLWRSDFGESDLYVDIIYTPSEYFNFIGGSSDVEGYKADSFAIFKVYINTHQNKLEPYPLDKLSRLRTESGAEYKPLLWKVVYDSADFHHREGVLVFKKIESGSNSVTIHLMDLPGQKERMFQWDLPIPEKP